MGPSQADCRNGQSLAELQGGRNTGDFHFAESGIRRYRYRPCPCGGTGRRARLKIVFRKEWGFDSLHGHHRSILAAGCFGTYEKYWRITLKDLLNYRSAIVVDVAKDVVLRAPERIGRDSIHVTD